MKALIWLGLYFLPLTSTQASPESVKATIDGVVRAPSAFSITFALLPSITATHELVVPRSMPIALVMGLSCSFGQLIAAAMKARRWPCGTCCPGSTGRQHVRKEPQCQ